MSDQKKVIEFLLNYDVDVNAKFCPEEYTPLYAAVSRNTKEDICYVPDSC